MRKAVKGAFYLSLSLSLLAVALLWLTDSTYLIKGVRATYLRGVGSPEIDDHTYFDLRQIDASSSPQAPYIHPKYNKEPLTSDLKAMLEATRSVGFTVFVNDSLVQEHYWGGFNKKSQTNTFSASKTIVTLLAQKAIEQGYLKGWNQKVQELIPELKGAYAADIEIKHLSTMTAGLSWKEHYQSPFTLTAKTYYTDHLEEVMLSEVEVSEVPGEVYVYQSGSTQFLAMCVIRATGMSLSEYASQEFWKPMGAEEPAVWQLDHEDGMEIGYCCFNTNARDFARFGLLAINQGNWRGKQILDSSFFQFASKGYRADHYGYSYWIDEDSHGTPVYYMRGREGQYVIVIPEHDIVISRVGFRYSKQGVPHKDCFHVYVDEVLKMYGK